MNQLNFNCPFCTNCIDPKGKNPTCGPINLPISEFNSDECFLFTATADGLRRQRWHVIKLIALTIGFLALVSMTIHILMI